MKKTAGLLLALCILFCGTLSALAEGTVCVSNLADEESRVLLEELLERAGVPKRRQRVFWAHVDQYNGCAGAENLLGGFEVLGYTESRFDEEKLQELWNAAYPDFPGYNCRLTAFGLMGSGIGVTDTTDPDLRAIAVDLDAAGADPSVFTDGGDGGKFRALFSTVAGENSQEESVQRKLVLRAWNDRGVRIKESALRLVTLWMHAHYADDDNELFAGHAGVLLDFGDGGLYFVEKLSFQEPYRFIRLESRAQLEEYLLTRYAEYQSAGEAPAFLLENGEPMGK